jgi:arabinose-5-phosphate isomerase
MRKENLPCVPSSMTIGEIIFIISKSRMGMAVVTDKNKILGVVTDGDIRRSMEKDQSGFLSVDAKTIMSKSPKVISPEARINEAEEVMRQNKIHSLLVTDQTNELLGILEFYDVSVFE